MCARARPPPPPRMQHHKLKESIIQLFEERNAHDVVKLEQTLLTGCDEEGHKVGCRCLGPRSAECSFPHRAAHSAARSMRRWLPRRSSARCGRSCRTRGSREATGSLGRGCLLRSASQQPALLLLRLLPCVARKTRPASSSSSSSATSPSSRASSTSSSPSAASRRCNARQSRILSTSTSPFPERLVCDTSGELTSSLDLHALLLPLLRQAAEPKPEAAPFHDEDILKRNRKTAETTQKLCRSVW